MTWLALVSAAGSVLSGLLLWRESRARAQAEADAADFAGRYGKLLKEMKGLEKTLREYESELESLERRLSAADRFDVVFGHYDPNQDPN